jgi:hypothetical protein
LLKGGTSQRAQAHAVESRKDQSFSTMSAMVTPFGTTGEGMQVVREELRDQDARVGEAAVAETKLRARPVCDERGGSHLSTPSFREVVAG